jgi:hypothetical protein
MKGKSIDINGIVQARRGARIILDRATYIRRKGMKFKEAS